MNAVVGIEKKSMPYNRRRERVGVLYALPAIIGFVLFNLIPMIACLGLSLTDYKVAAVDLNFLGLGNYVKALSGDTIYFYDSVRATFLYVLISVPGTLLFSFLVALLAESEDQIPFLLQDGFLPAKHRPIGSHLRHLDVDLPTEHGNPEPLPAVAGSERAELAVR